jgi:hypothetical protein
MSVGFGFGSPNIASPTMPLMIRSSVKSPHHTLILSSSSFAECFVFVRVMRRSRRPIDRAAHVQAPSELDAVASNPCPNSYIIIKILACSTFRLGQAEAYNSLIICLITIYTDVRSAEIDWVFCSIRCMAKQSSMRSGAVFSESSGTESTKERSARIGNCR